MDENYIEEDHIEKNFDRAIKNLLNGEKEVNQTIEILQKSVMEIESAVKEQDGEMSHLDEVLIRNCHLMSQILIHHEDRMRSIVNISSDSIETISNHFQSLDNKIYNVFKLNEELSEVVKSLGEMVKYKKS